jgi:hypothetical protein
MSIRSTILKLTTLGVLVSGYSTTVPVAVIGAKGQILRGTATAAVSGGSFSVTDGKLTCAGSYNALDMGVTISMPVQCNDGRKGIITATRNSDGMSGAGRVRLSDGMEADFIFGDAAASF